MVLRQKKVVFAWNEPRPRIELPKRLRFESVKARTLDAFIGTIARAIDGSIDSYDRARRKFNSPHEIADRYAHPDPRYFCYEMEWWQLAYDADDAIVGFNQPVVFTGCARSGFEEATIHYIGVVPEHRGHGYIVDLLAAATRRMQDLGVWRIFCDTDDRNRPMIDAFRRVGYEQGETRIVTHPLQPK